MAKVGTVFVMVHKSGSSLNTAVFTSEAGALKRAGKIILEFLNSGGCLIGAPKQTTKIQRCLNQDKFGAAIRIWNKHWACFPKPEVISIVETDLWE